MSDFDPSAPRRPGRSPRLLSWPVLQMSRLGGTYFVAQAPQGPGSREIFEENLVSVQITTAGDMAQAWRMFPSPTVH